MLKNPPDIIIPAEYEIVAEGNNPRIECKPAYSGEKLYVGRYDEPVILDIATLSRDPVPFVLYHDINKPLGMADVIAADDRQMDASGPLTHTTADYAKTEINASRNGFRHKASIHTYPPDSRFVTKILPGQIFYANGRNQIGPFYYVRNARLKNISLVTTPGDPNSNAQIIAQNQGDHFMPAPIVPPTGTGNPPATVPQSTPPQPQNPPAPVAAPPSQTPVPQEGQTPPPPATPVPTPSTAPPASIEAHAPNAVPVDPTSALVANQNRIAAIQAGGFRPEITAQAIGEGWSLQTAFEKNAILSGSVPGNTGAPPNVGKPKDDLPGDLEMIVASACQTAGLSAEDMKMVGIREQAIHELESNGTWRGAWMHDVMAHCVEGMRASEQRSYKRGRPTARYTGEALCYEAIEAQARYEMRYGNPDVGFQEIRADADTGFSTHGLKQIWTLITRASVLKAYNGVPSTWQHFCKKVPTKDFREHTMHRTGLVGDYERTNTVGNEPPHATYAEQMFKLASDQWDLMIAIPWKDLVSDEPGIFADRAQQLGRKAKTKQEKVVYIALLSADANLFTKNRAATEQTKYFNQNLFENPAGEKFWLTGISGAKRLMATARNPMDGELLGLRPTVVLVPQVREEEAKMFMTETRIGGNPNGPVNPHLDLKLVGAHLLNKDNGLVTGKGEGSKKLPGDDNAFYTFSDPYGDAPVLGIAFYQGQESPRIQTAETRFSTDGIQTKSTICFDVGTLDYRGGVKVTMK